MHLGLIMDGNGRWATKRSLPRAAGHLEGLKAAKRVVLSAIKLNIDYITLYVFSTENWKRPDQEVNYLMNLMAKKLPGEMKLYKDNDIRILFRGDIDALPKDARAGILKTVEETKDCKTLTVVLAVNYGGQDEIARACNRFIEKNPGKPISIKDIQDNLDLYAEFLAIDDLWPDWGEKQLQMCLDALSRRVRKYGGLVK